MAILEITLAVDDDNRPAAAAVYSKYREPFLNGVKGATSKREDRRERASQRWRSEVADDPRFLPTSSSFARLGTELSSRALTLSGR